MTSDWTEKNRAHFNEAASTYNTKFSKTILQIIDEIQTRRDWIGVDWIDDSSDEDAPSSSSSTPRNEGRSVRLLDYACGTGLVSRALAPYITQSIGIDISESMVNEYNTGALNQGIPSSEMRAVVGNLISPSPSESLSEEEFFGFDIAAVGLGFHHFDDPGLAAKRLAERLKVGGTLLIIDFLPHGHDLSHGEGKGHGDGEGSGHSHSHGHGHGHGHSFNEAEELKKRGVVTMGFSEGDVKGLFEEAGVGKDFEYAVLGKGIVFQRDGGELRREVFMARGRKG